MFSGPFVLDTLRYKLYCNPFCSLSALYIISEISEICLKYLSYSCLQKSFLSSTRARGGSWSFPPINVYTTYSHLRFSFRSISRIDLAIDMIHPKDPGQHYVAYIKGPLCDRYPLRHTFGNKSIFVPTDHRSPWSISFSPCFVHILVLKTHISSALYRVLLAQAFKRNVDLNSVLPG